MASRPLLKNTYDWLSVPWAEYITKSGSTQTGGLGWEAGNTASFTILVNFDDTQQAIEDILGTNSVNQSNLWMERTLPVRHPYPAYNHLFAFRIADLRGLVWDGKELSPGNGAFSDYEYSQITIAFSQPRWLRTLSDADLDANYPPVSTSSPVVSVRQEWQRFTTYTPNPSLDSLMRDASQWRWAETSGTGPTINTPINAPLPQYLPRVDLVLTTHRIPFWSLFPSGSFYATNQMKNLGCVNDQTFLGCPAQTLRLAGLRFEADEAPYPGASGDPNKGESPLFVRMSCAFSLFDPPPGATTHGHCLAPFLDGLWYKVYQANSTTTPKASIYPLCQMERTWLLNS